MKQVLLLLPILVCFIISNAQKPDEYAATDSKALSLPDSLTTSTEAIAGFMKANFLTETEKARAIFIWIATNIQYDVENMFAINFYEEAADKIAKPLRTRKGICENYAALFQDISARSGIRSYVVEGYTKQRGFTDYIPHAWCAAQIGGSWYLFDPTWGSGYVNNGKFFKKINNDYFKASPEAFIKSHMPFDYLWQFLHYPVTNQEFYEGKVQQDQSKPFFNYGDSLKAFEEMAPLTRTKAVFARVQKNGVRNSLVFDRLQHLQGEIANYGIETYNSALADYNMGVNLFNVFIYYRNNEFKPAKADPEIQAMIDTASNKLKDAKMKLSNAEIGDARVQSSVATLNKSIDDLFVHVREQQEWLSKYFSKGRLGRKSMFYKITWFGKPVN